jgi:hypothetical protein
LRIMGKFLERYAQLHTGDPTLKIAVFMRGSAKAGYSGPDSDVDYVVVVLKSAENEVFDSLRQTLDAASESLINAMGFDADSTMGHVSSLIATRPQGFQGPVEKLELLGMGTLFLPVAYGDRQLIEESRKWRVQRVSEQENPSKLWNDVRAQCDADTLIKKQKVTEKAHLKEWLESQGVRTPQEIDELNRQRTKEMGLPTLSEMARVYLRPPSSGLGNSGKSKEKSSNRGPREILGIALATLSMHFALGLLPSGWTIQMDLLPGLPLGQGPLVQWLTAMSASIASWVVLNVPIKELHAPHRDLKQMHDFLSAA